MSSLLDRPLLKRKSSEHQSVPVDPFQPDAKSFLQQQHTLPKMPLPSLDDTCDRYLSTVLPLLDSEEEKAATIASIESFKSGDGKVLHQHLTEYDAANDNYIEHFYREIYTGYKGSNFSLNPNFVLADLPGCDTAPKTAAALSMACLRYHVHIHQGTLPILQTRAGCLCMRQASWIFGTARTPCEGIDENVNFGATSKHIMVFCRGIPYQLTVLGNNDEFLADEFTLRNKFAEIIQHAKAQDSGLNGKVGALTTGDRAPWFQARQKILASEQSSVISAIDSALFCVALDLVSGLDTEGLELNLLYGLEGTFENRWMDKWTMIVCEDGKSGLNWEHSMLDGHTMMEFYATVAEDASLNNQASENQPPSDAEARDAVCVMKPLSFGVLDEETQTAINTAVDSARKLSSGVGIKALNYEGFGANFIKKCKCSPDAFVQMAMNLTYFDFMGKLPAPYESVLTKAFKHGRVAVARNMSEVIAENTKAFASLDAEGKRAAMLAMCTDTSRICKLAATANEFDRPFLAYRRVGAIEQLQVDFTASPGWARLTDLGLCTSQCGKGPIKYFGFEPPSADGFSIGYCVQAESIQAMVTHFDKDKTIKFTECFQAKMEELKALYV